MNEDYIDIYFSNGDKILPFGEIQDSSNIPDDFDTIVIDGVITFNKDLRKLFNILHSDARLWKKIEIIPFGRQPTSTGFFAIINTAMRKAKSLKIGSSFRDAAYSCLASNLLMPDGLEELRLHDAGGEMEMRCARLLGDVLPYTTCLKKFKLEGFRFEDDVCDVLVESLERNQSIETFELSTEGDPGNGASLQKLFRSITSHPKLHTLSIGYQNVSKQAIETLQIWLNDPDCRLENLEIAYCTMKPFSKTIRGERFSNDSLQALDLSGKEISTQELDLLCNSFRGLHYLCLRSCNLCDLSSLQSFLCKETCKIQKLDLENNNYDETSIAVFASKFPLMKSLKRLDLQHNPFLNQVRNLQEGERMEKLQPLLSGVKASKSIEQLGLGLQIEDTGICHSMNVNRGGRRGIEVESKNCLISPALWPKILHRALSLKYFEGFCCAEDPIDESPRTSVAFSLLQDHANIFDNIIRTSEREQPSLPPPKRRKIRLLGE